MAHQAHALPWNTLASNLEYKHSYTHSPHRKDIFPTKKPRQTKDIEHFCRVFAARIREFSETERAKYRPPEEYRLRGQTPNPDKVYPEEVHARYLADFNEHSPESRFRGHVWGGDKLQSLDAWTGGTIIGTACTYADMLKIMMMEAAAAPPAITASPGIDRSDLRHELTESMLILANHPDADIPSLVNLSHGHHFGLSRVAEEGIKAYVYLNVLVALRESGSDVCECVMDDESVVDPSYKQYMKLLTFERLLRSVAGKYDGDTQNLVHWDFFYARTETSWDFGRPKDVLADGEALQEYLKGVWRVLVVYDLVLREAGGDSSLESECRKALFDLFYFPLSN